ncbi:hypothetical protein HZB88_01410 [archaeon]|nr:hypothetical protein [archaeon]
MLLKIYKLLFKKYGKQGWWPLKGKYGCKNPKNENERFEICIGAILAQNTAWKNVEKALENLSRKNMLNRKAICSAANQQLAILIKPAGYYNQKARKLKLFASFNGKLTRENLLGIWGIGPETADSILLYAYNKPYFVVDTYTKRIFGRMGFKAESYNDWQLLFERELPRNSELYKEFHALIVEHGKRFCRAKAINGLCGKCVVSKHCDYFRVK